MIAPARLPSSNSIPTYPNTVLCYLKWLSSEIYSLLVSLHNHSHTLCRPNRILAQLHVDIGPDIRIVAHLGIPRMFRNVRIDTQSMDYAFVVWSLKKISGTIDPVLLQEET